jgi:type II secretory pathway predicted ATPase ExeA
LTSAAAQWIATEPDSGGSAGGFGFSEAPFEAAVDPRFVYPHAALQRVCAELLVFHASKRQGLFLIAGAPGTGKSILLADILEGRRLGEACVLLACRKGLSFESLVDSWGAALGLADAAADHEARLSVLSAHLTARAKQGATATLLLDRAEALPDDTLRALGDLAETGPAKRKLVRIVLAARPELVARLARADLATVKQTVAFEARLEALNEEDVGAYVRHRLAAAGNDGQEVVFSAEALEIVARASTGVPRLINVLCRTALEIAEATGQTVVSARQVETAIQACLQRAQERLAAERPAPPPAAAADPAGPAARPTPPLPARVWPVPVEGMTAGTAQARPPEPAAPWQPGKLARAAARILAALVVAGAVVIAFPARTGPSETAPAGLPFAAEGDKARAIAARPDALAPDRPAGSKLHPASVSGPVTAAAGPREQDSERPSWLGKPADFFAPGDTPGGPRRPGQRHDR